MTVSIFRCLTFIICIEWWCMYSSGLPVVAGGILFGDTQGHTTHLPRQNLWSICAGDLCSDALCLVVKPAHLKVTPLQGTEGAPVDLCVCVCLLCSSLLHRNKGRSWFLVILSDLPLIIAIVLQLLHVHTLHAWMWLCNELIERKYYKKCQITFQQSHHSFHLKFQFVKIFQSFL